MTPTPFPPCTEQWTTAIDAHSGLARAFGNARSIARHLDSHPWRGEQYCTVVFVFLLASLSSYCFGNGQWDNSASRPLDDAYSSSLLYTGNSACKQITQYGGMCDAGQPLETASPCVPMGGGTWDQRSATNTTTSGVRSATWFSPTLRK